MFQSWLVLVGFACGHSVLRTAKNSNFHLPPPPPSHFNYEFHLLDLKLESEPTKSIHCLSQIQHFLVEISELFTSPLHRSPQSCLPNPSKSHLVYSTPLVSLDLLCFSLQLVQNCDFFTVSCIMPPPSCSRNVGLLCRRTEFTVLDRVYHFSVSDLLSVSRFEVFWKCSAVCDRQLMLNWSHLLPQIHLNCVTFPIAAFEFVSFLEFAQIWVV